MTVIDKAFFGRNRLGLVERHNIPDPLRSLHDTENWENAIIKGRIPDLFRSKRRFTWTCYKNSRRAQSNQSQKNKKGKITII